MTFAQYVFVDYENVPSVDLTVVEGKPVHVTLLIGKQQNRFDLPFVQQAMRHVAQVELISVGVSGRNALDLVLAAYLGRASLEHKEAEFIIVSKDKDFDPLIAHLHANRVRVTRQPDFFTRAPRTTRTPPPPPTKRPVRLAAAGTVPPPPSKEATKLSTLVTRLTSGTRPLPKNKARLVRHVATHFGNKKSEVEIAEVIAQLIARGVVVIDERARVSYPKRA